MRITFFYAVILLSTSTLLAQNYHFDYYGVKNDLKSTINDVLQDNKGYIWLATESGVTRFDGLNVANFVDEDGFEIGKVNKLYKDSNGYIWIGHANGQVSFYYDSHLQKHPICDSLSAQIISFIMDKSETLWIMTNGDGLIRLENPYELNPENVKYEQYKGKKLSDRVFHGTLINDEPYFVTDAGIKKYDLNEDSFKGYSPEGLIRYFAFTTMLEDKKGDIWFGTYHGGLYQYIKEKNEFKIYDAARDGIADNWITSIFEDSKGNIWVGSWGKGITKISDEGIKVFNKENGLQGLKIKNISEDFEGNILLASYNNGLIVFKGETFETYGKEEGLTDETVFAILQDKEGKFWFGTNDGISVLNLNNNGKGIYSAHYNHESDAIGNTINFLKKDKNNNIWIGTSNNGINMYDYKTGRFSYNPVINRYVHNGVVQALDVDSKNQLWIGTQIGLIYYDITADQSQLLKQLEGLNGSNISAVFADSKDKIWVGIEGKGLNLIVDFKITKVNIQGTPRCFAEDKNGNILIGTQTKGILVYNGDSVIKNISMNDGLLSSSISSLNVDNEGNIFVGTNHGLNKIDVDGTVHLYTERSGFTGIDAQENSTFKDNNGNLWFGTIKGAIKYSPKKDNIRDQEPLTNISGIMINYEQRDLEQDMILNFTENTILFDYNSISFNNPEALRFQIKLEPAEKEWRPITSQTNAIYSSLAPGKYVFKVKAKNSAGIWNSEPVTYSFTIRPPFYKTWWFILSVIALGVITIVAYIKVREKNLIKEKKILEEKVEERTAEVVQKSIEIEKKNKDITDSIRYAKRIQTAVLPPDVPFKDTFIFFRPKDIVSGDFYWLETIKDREMIAAVDCTGHGVPGAFLSILGHSMLTKIVREYGILEPAKILDQLDQEIINALHQKNVKGERIVNDGMDLALISYNKKTNILEYAGGYNPLVRIRNGEIEEIKADRFPIGMTSVHDSKKFTNNELEVQKGDTFYIFSDGYADQFGGPDGKKFRKKNMKDMLLEMQALSMKEQGEKLEKNILEWMEGYDQIDDMVLIGRRF